MKSSNTFCFLPSIPALCQASPNSPPPRKAGTANTPPCCTHQASTEDQLGVTEMSKPPYPVSSVGRFRSPCPFLDTTNIGIFVPSLEAYQTCFASTSSGLNGRAGRHQILLAPLGVISKISFGYANDENAKKASEPCSSPSTCPMLPTVDSLISRNGLPLRS